MKKIIAKLFERKRNKLEEKHRNGLLIQMKEAERSIAFNSIFVGFENKDEIVMLDLIRKYAWNEFVKSIYRCYS